MKNKYTIWIRRGILMIILGMAFFCAFFPQSSALAAKIITVPNVLVQAQKAGEVHLVTSKMRRCVEHHEEEWGDVDAAVGYDNVANGNLFGGLSGWDVSSGAWLEFQVQNKVNNGTIYCSDSDSNIVRLFARTLDLELNQLLCQKDNTEIAGLIVWQKPVSLGGGYMGYESSPFEGCGSHLNASEPYYKYTKSGYLTSGGVGDGHFGGSSYIRYLYYDYAANANNPFLETNYEDIFLFKDPVRNYFEYLNDFKTACSPNDAQGHTIDELTTASNYEIPYFNQNDLSKINLYFKKGEERSTGWGKSFAGSGKATCSEVSTRLRELADDAQTALIKQKRTYCNSAVDDYYKELVAITNDADASDDEKKEAQSIIDQMIDKNIINPYIDEGEQKYYVTGWQKTENDGVVCAEIPGATYEEEEPEVEPVSGSGDPCYTNSGSLGWIVCPVITWLGDTLNAVYEEAVEPMLQIKSELFSGEGGNKTEAAWKIFRDIANIMFVILFLVVIFSQLTGVGIDNYGIKKILPKMIIAAVLINLSYVICQLAVDISNIAGAGLNGLLSSQAGSMSGLSGDFTSGTWFKHVIDAFLLLITGVGVGTVLYTAIEGGLLQLLLPLLMGFIVAFVAVIFFFALLGMRQAGVIIMVVTSPVAFAFYMLPNTKKLFDKWLKIFEGLLLLYPICGLLVGGSTLASTILVSGSTDFFIWLIGLLLMVVPFFFIPTLLKGSFAALGGIGAKIAGFGKKFGKGLGKQNDKLIKSTDTFRRVNNALGRHSLSRKRRAAAVSDTAAFKKEMGARRRLSDRGNMKTRIAAIEAAEEAKATDEATAQRLSLMMSSGEGGGIEIAGYHDASGTWHDDENGTEKRRAAYNLEGARTRVGQLEKVARKRALTAGEQQELSALARGMSSPSMKGGAGALGKIIRDSQDGAGNANTNFMSAMGEIYTRDSVVQSKMNEKDMGASAYIEHFMPGGDGLPRGGSGPSFTQSHATYRGGSTYQTEAMNRIKTYEAGLNQGGDAIDEYIASLTKEDCQAIMDDEKLRGKIDNDVYKKFVAHAATQGVTEPSAKSVQFKDGSKEMRALGGIEANTGMTASNTDRIATGTERIVVNTERTANGIDDVNASLQRHTRASMDAAAATLDNDTLMEIATNPQVKMDDPLREAAEREAKRRVQDGKMNP